MNIKKMNIEELTPANYNPRKDLQPNDPEYIKLKRSIETFGYVDPIIFNEQTGVVVGGHQRLKVLKDLGYKEIDVNVIDISETKEKALNVALNKISGEFDLPLLENLLIELDKDGFDVELTGFDLAEFEDMIGTIDEGSDYSDNIQSPVYEMTGDKPEILDLYDDDKTNDLLDRIEEQDLPEEVEEFLTAAAQRHIVFNYSNIAEFYAHSNKEVQELMEESALVIIDYDKAIEQGFVKLSLEIEEMRDQDDEVKA